VRVWRTMGAERRLALLLSRHQVIHRSRSMSVAPCGSGDTYSSEDTIDSSAEKSHGARERKESPNQGAAAIDRQILVAQAGWEPRRRAFGRGDNLLDRGLYESLEPRIARSPPRHASHSTIESRRLTEAMKATPRAGLSPAALAQGAMRTSTELMNH
jgi:hypothetical protein